MDIKIMRFYDSHGFATKDVILMMLLEYVPINDPLN